MLPENARLPRNIQGSFTCHKSTTWDKRLYFSSEGRRAEDFFFALKNPTASAGFEPANFGTKGQHATSRPLKPFLRCNFVLGCEIKISYCEPASVTFRLDRSIPRYLKRDEEPTSPTDSQLIAIRSDGRYNRNFVLVSDVG